MLLEGREGNHFLHVWMRERGKEKLNSNKVLMHPKYGRHPLLPLGPNLARLHRAQPMPSPTLNPAAHPIATAGSPSDAQMPNPVIYIRSASDAAPPNPPRSRIHTTCLSLVPWRRRRRQDGGIYGEDGEGCQPPRVRQGLLRPPQALRQGNGARLAPFPI
jgi:hypothetical protein